MGTSFGRLLNLAGIHFWKYIIQGVVTLYRVSIKSKENDKVLTRIVKEVKGLNPTFDGADIRGEYCVVHVSFMCIG